MSDSIFDAAKDREFEEAPPPKPGFFNRLKRAREDREKRIEAKAERLEAKAQRLEKKVTRRQRLKTARGRVRKARQGLHPILLSKKKVLKRLPVKRRVKRRARPKKRRRIIRESDIWGKI